MYVKANVRNYKQQLKELASIRGKSETALKRIVSDARTRVPGWVSSEVVKVYGIKKNEITPAKTGKASKPAGSIKVRGDTVETMQIVYTGRPLTPTHFGMTPKVPKESYTLKAEILKGNKATMGKKKKLTKKQLTNIGRNLQKRGTKNSPKSPMMLMHTRAGSADKTQYIPFQRKSQSRNDIQAIKTISLPQMVGSDRTYPEISRAINEGLEKRVAQHMKLLEK